MRVFASDKKRCITPSIPETDEQALAMLQGSDEGLTIALRGIYLCHRVLGKPVMEAYVLALEAHAKRVEREV